MSKAAGTVPMAAGHIQGSLVGARWLPLVSAMIYQCVFSLLHCTLHAKDMLACSGQSLCFSILPYLQPTLCIMVTLAIATSHLVNTLIQMSRLRVGEFTKSWPLLLGGNPVLLLTTTMIATM